MKSSGVGPPEAGKLSGAGRMPPAHRGLRPGGSRQYGILGSLFAL